MWPHVATCRISYPLRRHPETGRITSFLQELIGPDWARQKIRGSLRIPSDRLNLQAFPELNALEAADHPWRQAMAFARSVEGE